MSDIRLQRMAKVLVHHSTAIKEGDRLAIQSSPLAAPLVREIAREAVRSGAFVETFVSLPGIREILLKEGSDKQLDYIAPSMRHIIEEYETWINILSDENTRGMSGVDPARLAYSQKASRELLGTYAQRSAEGSLRWNICMFPTSAYAQDANMSLSDFEEFVYKACKLNDEDPVASWQELSRQQERYVEWLKGKRTIHIQGQDTDLTLSIEGRSFINDDGKKNFPGGEFFTSPVETSANGYIRYSFPAAFGGRSVEDVRLRFENGVVVEATAAQGRITWTRCSAWTRGRAAWASSPSAIIATWIAASRISSSTRRWVVPFTWRWATASPKPEARTPQPCTGIWSVTCAAAARFVLTASSSPKTVSSSSKNRLGCVVPGWLRQPGTTHPCSVSAAGAIRTSW
ncbi:hypothetical protein KSB_12650 [Ktedonobacter robiniae]|uniref:Aminopeptidase n=1 Tax=Ktedonobacter robiniae TaxID=2778365 RepID=A0ABQ3UJG6_9CHLR|nr:hypothetical protein KSB_12650 [Ktedonobacter robiniae]